MSKIIIYCLLTITLLSFMSQMKTSQINVSALDKNGYLSISYISYEHLKLSPTLSDTSLNIKKMITNQTRKTYSDFLIDEICTTKHEFIKDSIFRRLNEELNYKYKIEFVYFKIDSIAIGKDSNKSIYKY